MLKKIFNPFFIFIAAALFMQGCIKDHCTQTYSYFVPVYKTTEEVRSNIKSNAPREMERTGKIYIRGNYIFLNEVDKGIHIIDNAIPTAPKNVAFIDIPGNMDMAVKGNTLYADAYTDLITLDITDPLNAKTTKIIENTFPFRQYYGTFYADNSKVIVDWLKRDTTVNMDCGNGGFFGIDLNKSEAFMYNDVLSLASYSGQGNFSSSSKSVSPFGAGGSMARFAIAGYHLYSVTLNDLNVFEISRPEQPSFTNKVNIGWNIETIFPFQQKLFIGSTTGMYIYSISNGNNPVKEGQFLHVQSCDPVIADEKYAYVTLRTGTTCNSVSNRLEILDIADINSPSLVKTYEMTNPHGLSKDRDMLFICDGANGLKVYNATDVNDLKLITTIEGIETYDVIAMNNIALVVTSDGLYQYLYADPSNIQLLSKIKVKK
ncbi:hypothetical protein [Agriterribacter sp.]|uniref:LVIVD repeat-containing protein n=1 Tax=Agriterribacter sp. TaxID=2821509 RepID=UPI002C9B83E3|nr:hypothetical protein [Agriterribacter sp.]HRO47802.1 hypothetical protein [Agriterribacter sp.]HRQ18920.1 hypothetical protein [Agriterribacter sp.]